MPRTPVAAALGWGKMARDRRSSTSQWRGGSYGAIGAVLLALRAIAIIASAYHPEVTVTGVESQGRSSPQGASPSLFVFPQSYCNPAPASSWPKPKSHSTGPIKPRLLCHCLVVFLRGRYTCRAPFSPPSLSAPGWITGSRRATFVQKELPPCVFPSGPGCYRHF